MKQFWIVIILFVFSCRHRESDRIIIPEATEQTALNLLGEIRRAGKNDPDNSRLLNQELYYCEQLGWPSPCKDVLYRAKAENGMTEKLIDQMVAFHLKNKNYSSLENILNGGIETRSRLEAKIQLTIGRRADASNLLSRYKERYSDLKSLEFQATQYHITKDTTNALIAFEQIAAVDKTNQLLHSYYPLLMKNQEFQSATHVISGLMESENSEDFTFDLAMSLHGQNLPDSANNYLRKLNSAKAERQLVLHFETVSNPDSTLFYIDKLLDRNQADKQLLLSKAETLEGMRFVTRSLTYYERAFELDTLDSALAERVEIVRRKVAYLRLQRERKKIAPAPILERKTTTDN